MEKINKNIKVKSLGKMYIAAQGLRRMADKINEVYKDDGNILVDGFIYYDKTTTDSPTFAWKFVKKYNRLNKKYLKEDK
jgi:hypothetical protein